MLGFYNQEPESQKNANKAALALYGVKEMEGLFSKLCMTKGIRKSDIKEAIFDFQHKKYKSCCMIIFSLIDSKLIRLQRDEDRNPKTKRRYSGKKAAEKLQKKYMMNKILNRSSFCCWFMKTFLCVFKRFLKAAMTLKINPLLSIVISLTTAC